MNMVKKATLIASILLAMALTFGCSDDKDDKDDDKKNTPPAATEPKWCVTGNAPYLVCSELGDASNTMTHESCEAGRYSKLEIDLPDGCKNCDGTICECLGASCPAE